ncbi:TAXI family TRAP transporter solute-binding subunit [Bradyrhizobium sp.]|uniref:TAXI family TRAP transporter solute-binding subunit n=1 Tax=Bradyrhizobium sp. TaxID=376 RepID=UPI001EC09CEB|nr:TAXI family TRAP transporter solute-binding subunit [Bradyrhizobium sp.]MBV9980300.1 hypothetical protein [Bradyrhizobium sp.]
MRLCGVVRVCLLAALMAAAWSGGRVQVTLAQTQSSEGVPLRKQTAPGKDVGPAENRTTVGLLAGTPQCTESAIAQDIATTLASGQESGPHGEVALRVLPIVGNGGIRNLSDVLTLAGADLAIAPVVLADRLRDSRAFGDIRDKLVYVTPLYVEEFHLLARPEIASLADLAGKSVNLGEADSAGAVLGREVLNRLDVKINELNLGPEAALDQLRKGQIAAALLVSGQPVSVLAHDLRIDGVHFLSIPYAQALQQDYVPTTLQHQDYPDIIAAGAHVDTVAVESALFAYNWPARSDRFQLLQLFVQTLFSRFGEFLGDAHHPKWREVNLAAQLKGWQQFRPAERWVQREITLRGAFGRFLDQKAIGNTPDREGLFREFLQWRDRNQRR